MLGPRQYSWTIVGTTMALSAKQRPDAQIGRPNTFSNAIVTTAAIAGHIRLLRRLLTVDLRHASSGPVPVRNSRIRPIGVIHWLKNGAATVSRVPVSASLSVGNIVPNRMKNAENRRIQLFSRN